MKKTNRSNNPKFKLSKLRKLYKTGTLRSLGKTTVEIKEAGEEK